MAGSPVKTVGLVRIYPKIPPALANPDSAVVGTHKANVAEATKRVTGKSPIFTSARGIVFLRIRRAPQDKSTGIIIIEANPKDCRIKSLTIAPMVPIAF